MRRVTLYGREHCHLCEDAMRALERVQEEIPFELIERDIESDERLHRAYLERIPVVELDGRELFEYFVDEDQLRRALAGEAPGNSAAVRADDPLESGR